MTNRLIYLHKIIEKVLQEQQSQANHVNIHVPKVVQIQENEEKVAHVRKSRPDAMFHYPFTDEYGSVMDVLTQELHQERPDLLKMGGPGRKRLIEKIFDEMRFDRQGIRLSDLPEALSVSKDKSYVLTQHLVLIVSHVLHREWGLMCLINLRKFLRKLELQW